MKTYLIGLFVTATTVSSFTTTRTSFRAPPSLSTSPFTSGRAWSSTLRMSSEAAIPPEDKPGILQKIKNVVPSKEERSKLVPLAIMFFCILFNYTILRDTKDVLMVTAPKSGAEVIPFIKTYVNLPVAIVRAGRRSILTLSTRGSLDSTRK